MTAYVVRTGAQKKRGILEKREETLLHSLRSGFSDEKIERAAEGVRSAQLAVIKCLLYEKEVVRAEDENRSRSAIESLHAKSKFWMELPVSDIIDRYLNADDQ